MLHVCPTDVVRAPAEHIWRLATTPGELACSSDTTVIEAPDRGLRSGDRLVLGAGIGHRVKVFFRVQGRTQMMAVRPGAIISPAVARWPQPPRTSPTQTAL